MLEGGICYCYQRSMIACIGVTYRHRRKKRDPVVDVQKQYFKSVQIYSIFICLP